MQNFAREFYGGRKQDIKKDRRKGGPFFPVSDREGPVQRQRFRLDGFPVLFHDFRCDVYCTAAGGLCETGRIFEAAEGRIAEGCGEAFVEENDAVRAVQHEIACMDADRPFRCGGEIFGKIDVFFIAVQFFHRPRGGEPGEESPGGIGIGRHGGEDRAVHGEADAHGSESAAHVIGLRQGGMVFCRAGFGASAGKDGPRQTRLFKAVRPAPDGFLRTFHCFRRILGGGSKEIDLPESVFRGKERIHPVEERFQLTGNAVVINRGGKDDDVRGSYLFGDGPGIVCDDTASRFLTGKTACAEGKVFAFQRNFLYVVACLTRTGGKGSGKPFGIAPRTEAGRENEYVFHGVLLVIQERAGALWSVPPVMTVPQASGSSRMKVPTDGAAIRPERGFFTLTMGVVTTASTSDFSKARSVSSMAHRMSFR